MVAANLLIGEGMKGKLPAWMTHEWRSKLVGFGMMIAGTMLYIGWLVFACMLAAAIYFNSLITLTHCPHILRGR